MEEKIEACNYLLTCWAILSLDEYPTEKDFITKMIQRKFEVFEIPIVVPDPLCAIIMVCTNGNPGLSQIILKEILMDIPDLAPGYVITMNDFARTYGDKYPLIEYEDIKRDLETKWDRQKHGSFNEVDTKEYWLEVFK